MSNLFSQRQLLGFDVLQADLHSHLIPEIDDGSSSVEESIAMITGLQKLGFKKFITTPHIMPEYYSNTSEIIFNGLNNLLKTLSEKNIQADIIAAAEYYIDDNFTQKLATDKMLSFTNNYVLVETSMVSRLRNFEEGIFRMSLYGYKPVLAHPERYVYLYENHELDNYFRLKDSGVLFQINLRSFIGHYGEMARKIARLLVDNNMVDFLGTDIHHKEQLPLIKQSLEDKHVQKLLKENNLLNKTL